MAGQLHNTMTNFGIFLLHIQHIRDFRQVTELNEMVRWTLVVCAIIHFGESLRNFPIYKNEVSLHLSTVRIELWDSEGPISNLDPETSSPD
jgi:hypothetical protein